MIRHRAGEPAQPVHRDQGAVRLLLVIPPARVQSHHVGDEASSRSNGQPPSVPGSHPLTPPLARSLVVNPTAETVGARCARRSVVLYRLSVPLRPAPNRSANALGMNTITRRLAAPTRDHTSRWPIRRALAALLASAATLNRVRRVIPLVYAAISATRSKSSGPTPRCTGFGERSS